MHQRGKHPLAMDVYLHRRLICFPSNLLVTGFSSCRITAMIHSYLVWFLWWLRHGAIGPSEATLFGVNVDWIDVRIYTFELVIRLSNAKQLALRFSAILRLPAAPDVPGIPVICTLSSEAVPNFRNLFFCSNFCSYIASCHDTRTRQAHDLQVWCFFFLVFWWGQTYCAPNPLELESRLCQLGQELTTVPDRE